MKSVDNDWIKLINNKLENPNLNFSEKAYYNRILKVLEMPNLTKISGHPINIIVQNICKSDFFKRFETFDSPEIVSEYETFDLFYFPNNHVARRPSDSYFIDKNYIDTKKSMLLRPHTTVMWYHYLVGGNGIENLKNNKEINILSSGKVYRVDELDKTHHECFHQIDGLRICEKSIEIINQDTLKKVLINTIEVLFGKNIEYRFNVDNFPYTTDSLEVEVKYKEKWLEVLGAGVVHPTVLEKLGIDSKKYNGWAFGFGIERLAMPLKNIPDIRIFWSLDERIISQWGNLEEYKEISVYPPVYKDISIVVPKIKFQKDIDEEKKSGELELTRDTESDFFAITGTIRDIGKNLIEEVKIIDIYENDSKFGKDYKSLSIKIIFRSIERTLTNEEINIMYFDIRNKITSELGYELR